MSARSSTQMVLHTNEEDQQRDVVSLACKLQVSGQTSDVRRGDVCPIQQRKTKHNAFTRIGISIHTNSSWNPLNLHNIGKTLQSAFFTISRSSSYVQSCSGCVSRSAGDGIS